MTSCRRASARSRRHLTEARRRPLSTKWTTGVASLVPLAVVAWIASAPSRGASTEVRRTPPAATVPAFIDLDASDWARSHVARLLSLPDEAHRGTLAELAANSPEDRLPFLRGGLGDVTLALLERSRPDLVVLLDEVLPSEPDTQGRRLRIHAEIAEYARGGDVSVVPHAERMARRHPTSVHLASFRSGGVEFLLTVVESRRAAFDDRVAALYQLYEIEAPGVRRRLIALADDPMTCPENCNSGPEDPPLRFGDVVRARLQMRESDSTP